MISPVKYSIRSVPIRIAWVTFWPLRIWLWGVTPSSRSWTVRSLYGDVGTVRAVHLPRAHAVGQDDAVGGFIDRRIADEAGLAGQTLQDDVRHGASGRSDSQIPPRPMSLSRQKPMHG